MYQASTRPDFRHFFHPAKLCQIYIASSVSGLYTSESKKHAINVISVADDKYQVPTQSDDFRQ